MALQTKTFTSEKVNYYHLELVLTEKGTNASSNSSEVGYKLTLHAEQISIITPLGMR